MKFWLIIIAAILIFAFVFISPPYMVTEEKETGTIASELTIPWALAFLPDNRLLITERPGTVSIFENNKVTQVAQLDVEHIGEGGLHGIAVDPDFAQNKFIYVYYTYEENGLFNRVSRLEETQRNIFENEVILLDNIPGARVHNGGRIKIGPDGLLYITAGDAADASLAQDLDSLAGKILRINRDGTIPATNPFSGSPVYSLGHRNPQGLAWDENNQLYAAEHGPTGNDEINHIEPGANYGWPQEECSDTTFEYNPAFKCFEQTVAPAGLAYHKGHLYLATLRGSHLRKIAIQEDMTLGEEDILLANIGRLREVIEHEGFLYVTTSNRDGRGLVRDADDKILRIRLE